MSKSAQEYKLRNPWPKFETGDKVAFTETFMKYNQPELCPYKEGTVVATKDHPPDKTGLVDTYVSIKWDDGSESVSHASHLEKVS